VSARHATPPYALLRTEFGGTIISAAAVGAAAAAVSLTAAPPPNPSRNALHRCTPRRSPSTLQLRPKRTVRWHPPPGQIPVPGKGISTLR
jgi:hypothetical protein